LAPIAVLVIVNLPALRWPKKLAYPSALFLFAAQTLLAVFSPKALIYAGETSFLSLKIRADALSVLSLASIGLVLFVVALSGRVFFRDRQVRPDFASLLLVALAGMNAAVLATDLFSLYVFIEVVAITSYLLIAFDKKSPAMAAAFQYLALSALATTLLLGGVAIAILSAGTTSLDGIYAASQRTGSSGLLTHLALALFGAGLLIKSGLVPFHGWLPAAYSKAPAPVSVLLAGIVTKISGVYMLFRVVLSAFGFQPWFREVLLLFGAISIVAGAVAAIGENDFKKMLAYSSISQVGYIVVGLGCATPIALAGAAFHFFNHAVFKALLFVNAASIENRASTTDMRELGGLSERMPFTGATCVVGLLSAAGIPPLAGFWSKLMILGGLWYAGYHGYAIVALGGSLLTLGYFLIMQKKVFFGKIKDGLGGLGEVGRTLCISQALLASVTIASGIFFPWVLQTLVLPIGTLMVK